MISLSFILRSLAACICVLFVSCGEGVTPLMKAAKEGSTAQIDTLLQEKAAVDEQSKYGWTALMFACWQGHDDAVETLLEAGADPNISSSTVPSSFETVAGHPPSTALQEAIRNKHTGIAKTLIKAGAKLDPASVARAGGLGDLDFLRYLKSQGADFNTPSENAFAASALCAAASAGHSSAVRWLLANGASPNLVAASSTALIEAIRSDQPAIVRLLIQHGADVNLAPGHMGESPLYIAATKYTHERNYENNLSIIRELLRSGADPQQKKGYSQETPLETLAIQKANTEKGLQEADNETYRSRLQQSLEHQNTIIRLLKQQR
ncbi:hypothetical protein Rhal01_02561 [Rubritalea halochordaticola]|uniref:Ankyrin repeat domain-containing protein n=1 Tax=Rubritalea halochordaticola TaxID=714537 RepID=A0ABP9V1J2_9BACT